MAITLEAHSESLTLSREIPISEARLGPAARDQILPTCASDGDQYFVVWSDERGHVLGTRVSSDGRPLDPAGIAISTPVLVPQPGGVLFDGRSFVVFSNDVGAANVTMAHVSRSGVVTDRDRRLALPSRFVPAIRDAAWNGQAFLIAWMDQRLFGPSEPHLSVLDPDGELIRDEPGTPLALGSDGLGFLSIAYASGGTLVATSYRPDGNPTGAATTIGTVSSAPRVALAWNGDHYVLALRDSQSLTTQPLARDGRPLDTPHHIAESPSPGFGLALASAGGDFILCWPVANYSPDDGETTDLYAIHLHADGTPIEIEPFSIAVGPGEARNVVVASNGSSYVAAWQSADRYGDWNIFGRSIGRDAPGGDTTTLALSAAEQRTPSIAASGDAMIAGWYEAPNGDNDATAGITCARMLPNGEVLDRQPINISPRGTDHATASDGRDFLVAWREVDSPLGIAKVSAEGQVVRRETVDPTFGFGRPGAAFGAGVYLVAWQAGDRDPGVFAARVDRSGVLLDMPKRIGDALHVAVAFDGTDFVVVHDVPTEVGQLRVERVTPQMLQRDSLVVASAEASANHPAIACHDGNCVVVWDEWDEAVRGYEVRGVAVSQSSTSAPFPLADRGSDAQSQIQPSVAWFRDSFTVAWSEAAGADRAIVARRVAATGTFVSEVFGLTSGLEASTMPALAASRAGTLGVVYERASPEVSYGDVSRAFVRMIGFSPRKRSARPR